MTRRWLAGALLLALACGGRTDLPIGRDAGTPIDFPVGTFGPCADGIFDDDGNVFLRSTGALDSSSLQIARISGSTDGPVHATYAGGGLPTLDLDFVPVTSAVGALAPSGQSAAGFSGMCQLGIGVSNSEHFPATLRADSGSIVYSNGGVFLTPRGELSGGTGSKCPPMRANTLVWVACGGAPQTKAAAVATFPPQGAFSCTSQIATVYEHDGMREMVGSGGPSGTLVVSATSRIGTASYSGDKYLSGTFRFDAETAEVAHATGGSVAQMPCEVPFSSGTNLTLQAFDVESTALVVEGTNLVLGFRGTMAASSSCAGAKKSGVLVCTRE